MGSAGFMALLMARETGAIPPPPTSQVTCPRAGVCTSRCWDILSLLRSLFISYSLWLFLLKATGRRQPALRLQSLWELEQWLSW